MQTALPMPVPPATRRLSTIEGLRDWLCWTHEEAMQAIDSGVVPYAFDLRSPGAERSEVRLWHPNVEALVRSGGRDSGPRCRTVDELLAQIVPDLFTVRSSTLERIWTLSPQHVHQLIHRAIGDGAGTRSAARGPASYIALTPEMLRRFLRSRLIGHAATSLN